jgi:hypothetical protein
LLLQSRQSRRWIALLDRVVHRVDRVVNRVDRVAGFAAQFLACRSASFCPIGTIFTFLKLAD